MRAHPTLSALALLLAASCAFAQSAPPLNQYLIEREIKGAGNMTPVQLRDAAQKSNGVLRALGPDIQWVHSYVAGDKIYCVHEADDEEAIREHARRGGFPANAVTAIANEFGPHTAAS